MVHLSYHPLYTMENHQSEWENPLNMASNGYVDITRGSPRGGLRGERQVEPCDYIASVNGESDMEVATVHGVTCSRGRGPVGTERGDFRIRGYLWSPTDPTRIGSVRKLFSDLWFMV